MRNFVAGILALILSIGQAYSGQVEDHVVGSLTALGLEISASDRQAITVQVGQAYAATTDTNWYEKSAARLQDMAQLSKTALRPSARIRLTEMHRQLLELMVPGDNRALELAAAKDPMVQQFETGVGMTNRDLGWAVMLEAMRRDLPDDPRDLNLSETTAESLRDQIYNGFHKESLGAKHFLSKVDAWAFGTIAVWPELTRHERLIAVSVISDTAVPPAPLMEKVIGSTDILFWLAGMDIGLTQAETDAYPELTTYLGEGYMAGGVDGLLAQRVRMTGSAGAGAGTVQMMMELNYDLLFGNDLTAGGLVGLE